MHSRVSTSDSSCLSSESPEHDASSIVTMSSASDNIDHIERNVNLGDLEDYIKDDDFNCLSRLQMDQRKVSSHSTSSQSNIDETKNGDNSTTTVKLQKSLFYGRKPTIFFQYGNHILNKRQDDENTYKESLKVKLFYKGGELNCLRQAFKINGIKKLTSGKLWNIYWGKHLEPTSLLKLNSYQKVNHFPGSWNLGRKDNLSRNFVSMRRNFPKDYNFFAKTFVLSDDMMSLKREIKSEPKSLWILKPSASACGRGIKVIQAKDIPNIKKTKNVLLQKYILNPLLIDGSKFDLRVYVLVTSFEPLRVYVFNNGLVRICTAKYSTKPKHLKNRYRHLTNYSVNKKANDYVKNVDAECDEEGHKWSFHALRKYFATKEIDYDAVFASMHDVIVKTLIAAESPIASKCNRYIPHRSNVFEVFGFDILLDNQLKPWIIEVNVSPSLSGTAPLDRKIKNILMNDVYHLSGIGVMCMKKASKLQELERNERLLGNVTTSTSNSGSITVTSATSKRKTKSKNIFHLEGNGLKGLGKLSASEIDLIATLEDESARIGNFTRIFPTKASYPKYKHFFSTARYNNILYHLWLNAPISLKTKLLKYRKPPKMLSSEFKRKQSAKASRATNNNHINNNNKNNKNHTNINNHNHNNTKMHQNRSGNNNIIPAKGDKSSYDPDEGVSPRHHWYNAHPNTIDDYNLNIQMQRNTSSDFMPGNNKHITNTRLRYTNLLPGDYHKDVSTHSMAPTYEKKLHLQNGFDIGNEIISTRKVTGMHENDVNQLRDVHKLSFNTASSNTKLSNGIGKIQRQQSNSKYISKRRSDNYVQNKINYIPGRQTGSIESNSSSSYTTSSHMKGRKKMSNNSKRNSDFSISKFVRRKRAEVSPAQSNRMTYISSSRSADGIMRLRHNKSKKKATRLSTTGNSTRGSLMSTATTRNSKVATTSISRKNRNMNSSTTKNTRRARRINGFM